MNKEQFEQLNFVYSSLTVIGPEMLSNLEPRTLLTGYTCDRYDFVVELGYDGNITVSVETDTGVVTKTHKELESNNQYVPDKRVYVSQSDFEFCALLLKHGVQIPFSKPEW